MCDCDCELPKRERWRLIKDEHAHELAEKIRNTPSPDNPDDYGGFVDQGADWAADLIDPHKEGQ
jgi:hypothetical protein